MTGKSIIHKSNRLVENTLDLSQLSSGNYIINITFIDNSVISKKIVHK